MPAKHFVYGFEGINPFYHYTFIIDACAIKVSKISVS